LAKCSVHRPLLEEHRRIETASAWPPLPGKTAGFVMPHAHAIVGTPHAAAEDSHTPSSAARARSTCTRGRKPGSLHAMPPQPENPMIRSTPVAPVLVSFLLLAGAAAYLAGVGGRQFPEPIAGSSTPPDGSIRLIAWNLGGSQQNNDTQSSTTWSETEICDTLAGLNPHIVALQGLSHRSAADDVADLMGSGWRTVSLPVSVDSRTFLAVMVHPQLTTIARSLPETATPRQALALTLRTPNERSLHIICTTTDSQNAEHRRLHVDGLIEWWNLHQEMPTILIGCLDLARKDAASPTGDVASSVDHATLNRLSNVFSSVLPDRRADGHHDERIYFAPPSLRVVSCFESTPQGADAEPIEHLPLVVDFVLP